MSLIKLAYNYNNLEKDYKKADRKRWQYPLGGAILAGGLGLAFKDPMVTAQTIVPLTLGGWAMGENVRANRINNATFKALTNGDENESR